MRERILTSEQVAGILQVHPFTVLKYIKQGKLKGSNLGRMYRIRESDVEAFLNKNTAQNKEVSPKAKTTSAPQTSPTASAVSRPERAAHTEHPATSPQPPAEKKSVPNTQVQNTESLDQDFLLD